MLDYLREVRPSLLPGQRWAVQGGKVIVRRDASLPAICVVCADQGMNLRMRRAALASLQSPSAFYFICERHRWARLGLMLAACAGGFPLALYLLVTIENTLLATLSAIPFLSAGPLFLWPRCWVEPIARQPEICHFRGVSRKAVLEMARLGEGSL